MVEGDLRHLVERVDHRVAGDHDGIRGDPLAAEVLRRPLGRREVDLGDRRGDPAVALLGERRVDLLRPKAGLDVAEADSLVEGGQTRRHRGRGVALDEDPLRALLLDHLLDALHHRAGDPGQRLPVDHDVEVVVGLQLEGHHHLVEQLAVLGGGAEAHLELGALLERADHGRHLDRAGAGPDHHQDLALGRPGWVPLPFGPFVAAPLRVDAPSAPSLPVAPGDAPLAGDRAQHPPSVGEGHQPPLAVDPLRLEARHLGDPQSVPHRPDV